MYKLYDYFRSSACFRVRIALNLKQIPYEQIPIHLLKDGGQHLQENYRAINPQGLVPALEIIDSKVLLNQSLAIIEYLEETHPAHPLLPSDKLTRAKVRALAQMVAYDIHPIDNLRVLKYLKHEFHATDEQKNAWYAHWIHEGFAPIEKILEKERIDGPYCFGNKATMADLCLIPQVFNAIRFEVPLNDYPLIQAVYWHCIEQPSFDKAMPENQAAKD